jgi:hypothetical protein
MSGLTSHQSALLIAKAICELADKHPGDGVAHCRWLTRQSELGLTIDPYGLEALAPRRAPKAPSSSEVLTNRRLDNLEKAEAARPPIDVPGVLTNSSLDRELAEDERRRTLRQKLARARR